MLASSLNNIITNNFVNYKYILNMYNLLLAALARLFINTNIYPCMSKAKSFLREREREEGERERECEGGEGERERERKREGREGKVREIDKENNQM